MKLDLNHSWPKLLLAAVVVIAPSTLSYCKSREDAKAENAHARREADAGYRTLVNSVEKLEAVVTAQQQTLKLLTDRTNVPMVTMDAGVEPAAGSAASGSGWEPTALPAAYDVQFEPLPDNTAQALRQMAPAD